MGLFNKKIEIYAPFSGILMPLEEVPDEAFANKLIGEGLAIRPYEDDYLTVYSMNAHGNIHIFDTHHVISYDMGKVGVLCHIGLNTFLLKGKGLEVIGNSIPKRASIHTPLIKADYNFIIEQKRLSLISPIIIRNIKKISDMKILKPFGSEVIQGEHIMTLDIM